MISINTWIESYLNSTPISVSKSIEVEGLCKIVTGGRCLYAKVLLEVLPSNDLIFEDQTKKNKRSLLDHEAWTEAAFLGILDYMLVMPITSISRFHCVIKELDFHDIDSSSLAFRLAGRNAAKKILEAEGGAFYKIMES